MMTPILIASRALAGATLNNASANPAKPNESFCMGAPPPSGLTMSFAEITIA
jgi:hypothetical protein